MSKKFPVCLSMDKEAHESLKKRADAKGVFISEFVRQLIGHFCLDRDDIKAVVLQIPANILVSKELLKNWLDSKSAALVKQFFPEECRVKPNQFAPEQIHKFN